MTNYATDLHRQGRIGTVQMMENKARRVVAGTRGGLAYAFLTGAYQGADCYAIIANDKAYENKTGYVVWNEDVQQAQFIPDED